VSWGIWLFPMQKSDKPQDLVPSTAVPAVTQTLRAEGFGVMTPQILDAEYFIIAAPSDDSEHANWLFYECDIRHNTQRPGGWYYVGLQIRRLIDLDTEQRIAFRERVAAICPTSIS